MNRTRRSQEVRNTKCANMCIANMFNYLHLRSPFSNQHQTASDTAPIKKKKKFLFTSRTHEPLFLDHLLLIAIIVVTTA